MLSHLLKEHIIETLELYLASFPGGLALDLHYLVVVHGHKHGFSLVLYVVESSKCHIKVASYMQLVVMSVRLWLDQR